MHVLYLWNTCLIRFFFSNQKIFSYDFQCNLYKCTIHMSFSLLKKSTIVFLYFSKLDLNAYLFYYMLFIAFYLKNYYIFYHSLSKNSFRSPDNACESPSIVGNHFEKQPTFKFVRKVILVVRQSFYDFFRKRIRNFIFQILTSIYAVSVRY